MVDDKWLINDDYIESAESGSAGGPYETERKNVQLAMIALMADNGTNSIKPQTTWINDLSGEVFIKPDHVATLGFYLEGAESMKVYYQWDAEGHVYQCEDTSCPDPF